jgi:hypothetical protein
VVKAGNTIYLIFNLQSKLFLSWSHILPTELGRPQICDVAPIDLPFPGLFGNSSDFRAFLETNFQQFSAGLGKRRENSEL